MANNSIVHFEIPADDVPRATAFYKKTFGWKISDPFKMDYFFVVTHKDGEMGINGGLMKRQAPGQVFMNYIDVTSIDKMIAKLEAAGGKICMPKTEIAPGMGWIAIFQDTEGNMMGLHQAPKQMPVQPGTKKKAAKKKGKKTAKKTVKKAAKKKAGKKKATRR
jgi:predicted enzyme related to lactoylglutathione lyase